MSTRTKWTAGAGVLAVGVVAVWILAMQARPPKRLPVEQITLPPGFSVSIYARVPHARSMSLGNNGTLFVGTRQDKVYAIVDRDRDGQGERVITLASGLDEPNGVAFRDGALYVAEVSRVLRYDDIEKHLEAPPQAAIINDNFPKERHHGWKFISFGPDGLLYVPVGAPCNICKREDERFASIMRMKPDGGNLEVFAHGVRNTVGFDWHPETKGLWFTENGRDWMGDDQPPDELNRAPKQGLDFGFPYWHGDDLQDPDFGKGRKASEFIAPERKLGPHVAALGMRFYTGRMFPREYHGHVFIAEHGSWNRSKKIGYRVMLVRLGADGRTTSYEPFAEGWLHNGKVWGRPVDVLVMPDGALLVSDDEAGAIYRITYASPATAPTGR